MTDATDALLAAAAQLEGRYRALEEEVARFASESRGDPKTYQQLARELAELRELATVYRTCRRLSQELAEAEAMARQPHGDAQWATLAREEVVRLQQAQVAALAQLRQLWEVHHREPERPFIVEIRAGTGGLEASLFVADLYRMYAKFAAAHRLTVEPLHTHPSEAGGFKEAVFAVRGPGAWSRFKYESGVHRVQRVPSTEAQGRIHTSTATVAVLPEPEEVELPAIPAKDLQIDVYRASGPGGQGVNTTDSAVRVRHLPTGLMVACQDERSQLQNKEKALRVLRARLLDHLQQTQQRQLASTRRQQVGSGDRSEKIRTYNFPDRRVTDHRIGLTLHQLDLVLEGQLGELVDALAARERAQQRADASR